MSGTSDDDMQPSTSCASCLPAAAAETLGPAPVWRQYTASSAAVCTNCTAGTTDHDAQADTVCTSCQPGFFAEAGHSGECASCPAGRFNPVSGGQSVDACDVCGAGSYAAAGSSSCAFCSGGTADEDSDASTECTTCPVGTYSGCSETQCNVCAAGQVTAT